MAAKAILFQRCRSGHGGNGRRGGLGLHRGAASKAEQRPLRVQIPLAGFIIPSESMPKKQHPGRRGDPVSLRPLSVEQAVSAIFKIKPDDVKRIVSSRPGKKKK
jgi:hypothetical protein